MSLKPPSRRVFLGAAVATGAGAALLGTEHLGPARLTWCTALVHPLAEKKLSLVGAELPKDTVGLLRLVLEGPGLETPLVLQEEQVDLSADETSWTLRLSYEHPEFVPGTYRYYASLEVDSLPLKSEVIEYTLRPFVFGI